ncbi:hypothetical protein ACF8Q9_08200 [Pseudomonas sp. TYF_15]|uniref:hypothetical protein n=1 Tax=Pseudomonas sp. TYF_15 TaxID=3367194 RepID=UPI00370CD39C
MGVKMNLAIDQNGLTWEADNYQHGLGAEPLKCTQCSTPVTYTSAHTREMYDKAVLIPGYFRLRPNSMHDAHCSFGVIDEINTLVKDSDGLIESIAQNKYQMRLVMLKEALQGAVSAKKSDPVDGQAKTGRTYTTTGGRLPAYINSASKALKLRAICESNSDIEQHLELIFERNVKVACDDFYFDPPRHMEAFRVASQNTVQHPIALEGYVLSVRTEIKNDASKNVMTLQMNRFQVDANDPKNGIGLEISIWAPKAEWIKGLKKDDVVVVMGVWKPSISAKEPAPNKGGHFETLTKRRLSLNMVLKAQVIKV